MRIKELDDELGKGIGVYLDGRFFEVRNQLELQSRIYGNDSDSNAVVLIECQDRERSYQHFKILTERIKYLLEINIRNRKEDFIRYLTNGFEKEFRGGRIKINPVQQKEVQKLRKYAIERAMKYGILTEILGWAVIASTYSTPKITAVLGGFYFVFGDVICGVIVPWLADLGKFTSPFFQIGAYPVERRFFRKYLSLDKGLLAYFKKKSIKLKKIEEEFNKTPKVERKSYLSQRLLQEEKRLSREWEPIALSFEKSENLKAIIIGYRGTYQNSFAFSNYIINGTEPKEEDMDIWRMEIEEPQKTGEEADFDRIWGKEDKEEKDK
jgi:hypothetical protein